VEPEVGYDAAYTDFYPFINAKTSYTISADIKYNFNMSFVVTFEAGKIYAYELWPETTLIKPGIQRIGIMDKAKLTPEVFSDKGQEDPVYNPGDKVTLNYYFKDAKNGRLNRILNYTEARLILPTVIIWDPHGVPIANSLDLFDFFEFSFDLPLSAVIGEYKAEIVLESGLYGRIATDFLFKVQSDLDLAPPQIRSLEIPENV